VITTPGVGIRSPKSAMERLALLLMAVLSLVACKDVVEPSPAELQGTAPYRSAPNNRIPPQPPRFDSALPQYPAPAVYIVYREFVNKHRDAERLIQLKEPYWQYLERRLLELYPDRGYRGMLRDADREANQNRAAWAQYKQQLHQYNTAWQEDLVCPLSGGCYSDCSLSGTCLLDEPNETDHYPVDPSWTGQEDPEPDLYAVPSLQEEIGFMQLTSFETERLYYYEALARGEFAQALGDTRSLDDLIRAAGEGRTSSNQVATASWAGPVLIGLGIVAVGAYVAWRIDTSRDRAESEANRLYPHLSRDGTQKDAFRHTFLAVQLHRYVGDFLAFSILTGYELVISPNPQKKHTVMDLHNNDLGRSVRYRHFRGHWLFDALNWSLWRDRVHAYIGNTANGVFISEWEPETADPSFTEAFTRKLQVPLRKYIYFREPPHGAQQ